MRQPLSPEELQELIAGYVLYDLSPEESALFEQMLAGDPAIATEVERMQQALETTYGMSEIAPPAHLQAAVLAPPIVAAPVGEPPLRVNRNRWTQVWQATAAALIVGLSVSNYWLWRSLQSARLQLAQTEPQIITLQPTRAEVAGAATIAVNSDALEATLTVENLPPLPPGKVYVLWTVLEPNAPFTTDSKNAILTQVFTVNATGQRSEQIALPPVYQTSVVQAIAITIEDAAAPQRHEASPILIQWF